MKKLLLAVVVSVAVTASPAFAHHPTFENENIADETAERINDNLEAVDSPHLLLDLSLMGGTSSDMDAGSDDPMSQPTDADLDRIQGGEQTSDGVENEPQDAGEENEPADVGEENHAGYYVNQETNYRPGVAADEDLNPEQTETNFRAEVSTPSAVDEEGVVKLYAGDRVRIASELMVDEQDVGKTAECLAVAQAQQEAEGPAFTFMLAENGWEEWDGNFDELTGAKCELGENHKITAYEGEVVRGEFAFYFGYQFQNGEIVVNPEPLKFTVN